MNAEAESVLTDFGLNSEQMVAATTQAQNTLVLAGAGTGKTRTIVARIAHLVTTGTDPRRIVALTFTRASAQEMAGRVASLVGHRSTGLQSTTFHAWAMRLIRSHPEVFGYEGWSVIDADDQRSLMGIIRGRRKAGEFPAARELLSAFSFSRNAATPLRDAIASHLPAYVDDMEAIVAAAHSYARYKQDRKYLDYDDILAVLAATLESRPDVADWLGQNLDHLLIDEMQDTNPLQWRIIDSLMGRLSLFAVGDDAQSIYGFRGADFASIHSFSERVPDTFLVRLEENYRSTQEILDVSNWLLANSPLDYNKHLRAARGTGQRPEMREFENKFLEAAWIADDISAQHDEGLLWRDHLALVRTNYGGRALEGCLLDRKIPYRYLGGTKLLESAHIRDVLSALRVAANPRDDLAWMRLLCLLPKVGEVTATNAIVKMLDALDLGASTDEARSKGAPMLGKELLTSLNAIEAGQQDVPGSIRIAVEALRPLLENKYSKQNWEARRRDYEPLIDLAKGQPSIGEFISEYLINPVYVSKVEAEGADDAVTIATVHSAKGLEATRGYVVDVSPGRYPWANADGDHEVEEERRVLYVALTRAKDFLSVTRASSRSNHVENNALEEAYFLADLPEGLLALVVDPNAAPPQTPFVGSAPQPVNLGFDA